jgi:hypothetical protein
MEQLSLLPVLDKETEKKIQREIVSILKEFRALKVCFENEAEQIKEGISLFPEIRDTKRINQIKYRQVSKALQYSLDEDEVKIIQMKYLSNKKLRDDFIYNELLIKKSSRLYGV